MDPQIIRGISNEAEDIPMDKGKNTGGEEVSQNKIRRLDLLWSGNNAVLRAWGEPEGLPMLPHIERITITVPDHIQVCPYLCLIYPDHVLLTNAYPLTSA